MFRFALVAAFALPVPAYAASCADMVRQAEAYLAAHPEKAGTAPQTVDAQLQHQPTSRSVAKAKMNSRDHLAASLANAKAMQTVGDEAGCRASFATVAWMLKP